MWGTSGIDGSFRGKATRSRTVVPPRVVASLPLTTISGSVNSYAGDYVQ